MGSAVVSREGVVAATPYPFPGSALVFIDTLPVNIGCKVDIPRVKSVAGIDLTKNSEIPEFIGFLNSITATENMEASR